MLQLRALPPGCRVRFLHNWTACCLCVTERQSGGSVIHAPPPDTANGSLSHRAVGGCGGGDYRRALLLLLVHQQRCIYIHIDRCATREMLQDGVPAVRKASSSLRVERSDRRASRLSTQVSQRQQQQQQQQYNIRGVISSFFRSNSFIIHSTITSF